MTDLNIKQVHEQASKAAKQAADEYFQKMLGGVDQMMCGFAWVDVYDVRGNSRLGRQLKEVGFTKSYVKSLQLWNPSEFACQNVDTLRAGAEAYAKVLVQHGLNAVAGSRLD